jgi:hypothetical protein
MNHHWRPHWVVDWDDDHGDVRGGVSGAAATREIAWPGGDRIVFDVPADVRYTQGPGPAKLVIAGPKDVLDHLELAGDELKSDEDFDDFGGRLQVTMTAPGVQHFAIDGDNTLAIAGYDQSDLDIEVSGKGDVTARGKTADAKVDISGAGNVDLSELAARSVKADISGLGHAAIAPTDEADLSISGAGEIKLLTHPAKLSTDISGAGHIVESAPAPAPATNAAAKPA